MHISLRKYDHVLTPNPWLKKIPFYINIEVVGLPLECHWLYSYTPDY